MTITADQLRAARAMLKMEQRALAEASDVPVQTLKRYEGGAGPLTGNYQNIASIIRVLEEAGVTFLSPGEVTDGGHGVRMTEKPRIVLKAKTSEHKEAEEREAQESFHAREDRDGSDRLKKLGPDDE